MSIRKDGSGNIEFAYILPDNTSAQMKAMDALKKEMIKAAGETYEPRPVDRHFELFMDPTDAAVRDLMKTYEPYGIALERFKIEVLEGRKRIRLHLRFANLAKAAESDLFRLHWPTTLVRQANGSYRLNVTNGWPSEEPDLDFSDPATLKAITPILKDFKATIRINTPGEIVSAGTPNAGKHSAVWAFSFNEDPRAFSAFRTANMSIRFHGDGLTLPEIKPTAKTP